MSDEPDYEEEGILKARFSHIPRPSMRLKVMTFGLLGILGLGFVSMSVGEKIANTWELVLYSNLSRHQPGLNESPEIAITVVEGGIVDVVHKPLYPSSGQVVTFSGDLRTQHPDLVREYEVTDFNVRVWWVPQDSRGLRWEFHFNNRSNWTAPKEPGAAMYMLFIHGQERMRGTRYVLTFSNTSIIPVPRSTPVVEDSPLIQLSVEKPGQFRTRPYARIIVKVAKEGEDPIVTDLYCSTDLWICGLGQNYSGAWSREESCGHCGGFRANGTEDNEWVIYVAEPDESDIPLAEACLDSSLPAGKATGLVVCWVSGRDRNGTIHFAKPLLIRMEFSESTS